MAMVDGHGIWLGLSLGDTAGRGGDLIASIDPSGFLGMTATAHQRMSRVAVGAFRDAFHGFEKNSGQMGE